MSEKKLTFIIDSKRAESGAKKIKEGVSGIQKAYENAKKAAQGLHDPIKRSTIFLREQTKQQEGYYKSLVDTLTPTQKLTLFTKAQTDELNKLKMELSRIESARSQEIASVRDELKAKKNLDSLQRKLNATYTEEYQQSLKLKKAISERNREILGLNKTMTDAEKAQDKMAKSLEFWEQREKDLGSAQYQKLIRLRESSRQLEAYQKSLVNALTPAQQLAKAENQLARDMQASEVQLKLYEKGIAQKAVAQREQLSIQKQLAQSEERLKQTYTEEYAQLLKNNEAIKKRRRELLGLDDAQKKASKSTSSLSAGMSALTGALGAFSGGFVAVELVRIADAYTAVQNRLAVVTDGTRNLTLATRELLDVSVQSRTDLSSTMDVYAKLTRVTKGTSIQQSELLGITETLSKAVAMSGASAQGAQGALLQFSQALAGDFKASAQELNSIIEQTPAVAQTMADALNSVNPQLNASIGNLKRLATEGRFSTEELLQGFINIKDVVDRQFNNSMRTVAQSVQAVKDAFTVALGEVDKATGASKFLSTSLLGLAESLDEMKASLAGAAVGVATFVGVIGAGGITSLLLSLGPLGLAISGASVALGLIAGSLTKSAVEMDLLKKETEELTEANKKLEKSLPNLKKGYEDLSIEERAEEFNKVQEDIKKTADELEKANKEFSATGSGSTMDVQAMLLRNKQVNLLNEKYDQQKKKLEELQKATADAFDGDVVGNFTKALDMALGRNTEVVKTVKDVVKALDAEANAQEIANRKNAEAQVLMDAYALAKEQGVEVTTEFVKAILKQDKLIDSTSKRLEEQASNFESLRKSLDPIYSATQEYAKAMETLNASVEKGTPLWETLATTIGNKFNEVIQEARRNTAGTLEYLEAKVQETTEYLASRIQGGQDTGAIDFDKITSVLDKPQGKTSTSFEKMAQNFLDKLDKGILGPKGAAEMLVGLRTYADKLGALGEGFDVAGMKGAVMNLTAIAKEKFGEADLSDLTMEELAQVFKEEQEKARKLEEQDLKFRTDNHENLQLLADWAKDQLGISDDSEKTTEEQMKEAEKEKKAWEAWQKAIIFEDNDNLRAVAEWARKQSEKEDQSPKGTVVLKVVKEDGKETSGVITSDVDFLTQLSNTLSKVSSSVG